MNDAAATEAHGSAYTRHQAMLAASPAGILAATMGPGTRWLTPSGVVTIWKGWAPDLTGWAEEVAREYHWPAPAENHNSELGVTSPAYRTGRVNVADVGDWRPAPVV